METEKQLPLGDLIRVVRAVKSAGKTVVFTNGCFDLLHSGNVMLLQSARQLGDLLIVASNSDESVGRLKGEGRPILPEQERLYMRSALACVVYVVLFQEETPILILEKLRPDDLVKDMEYRHDQVVRHVMIES